ncbi:MAG: hypothetical protein COT85_01315 [Chlamydiae bacterium CG10_big_fil_rev_8_21_14_0_10_42_34]|nr:MAG: hypothetical protein COT85_01315 [Chlamydiae bacterium CG10_big_fil_rev_8_21_14_0_10_42_34]
MKFFYVLLLSSISLLAPFFLKSDFKIPPSYREIGYNPSWEMPCKNKEIFNQTFTYLTHGNQSTVFTSEDGKYVLKIFRYNRTRFTLLQNLKQWCAKKLGKKPKADLFTKAIKTFTAAHIACNEAKEFSQAIYCHLNLTENQLPIVKLIKDKTYHIPLDKTRFVLQKKAEPFKETLQAARANPEQMHQLIESWVNLLVERSAMGIRNADPNLGPNFGFIGAKAVEIDFGNYRKMPQSEAEIEQYFVRFEDWLKANAPEYINYLKDLRTKTVFSTLR